jgi:beta-phosphoglucomutase family hydrolase
MRTVIFDMDGVIVESEDFHCEAWMQAYKTIGIEIDRNYYFSKICGKHGLQSTREVLEEFGKPEKDDQQFREMLIMKKDHLAADMLRGTILSRAGVLALIRRIAQSPRKIGLGSTSSMIAVNAVLSTLNIEDQFNVMIGGEGVKNGKPHPEVYLKIAQLLEEQPYNCIVIEDSQSGINAAKSAGMKCIAVLNERNKAEDLQHADTVVGSFAEITDEVLDTL